MRVLGNLFWGRLAKEDCGDREERAQLGPTPLEKGHLSSIGPLEAQGKPVANSSFANQVPCSSAATLHIIPQTNTEDIRKENDVYLEVIGMTLPQFILLCIILAGGFAAFLTVTLWFLGALNKTSPEEDEPRLEASDCPSGVSMRLRESFWVCDDCGQEFRLLDGSLPPLRCPNCGAPKADDSIVAEDEYYAETYICPVCGRKVVMLDGEEPEYCPYCGSEPDEVWTVVREGSAG